MISLIKRWVYKRNYMKKKKLTFKFFNTWTHAYYSVCWFSLGLFANSKCFTFDLGLLGFAVNVAYGPTAEYYKEKANKAGRAVEKALQGEWLGHDGMELKGTTSYVGAGVEENKEYQEEKLTDK